MDFQIIYNDHIKSVDLTSLQNTKDMHFSWSKRKSKKKNRKLAVINAYLSFNYKINHTFFKSLQVRLNF